MHAVTDESLVLASREGNRDAFADLIERYRNLVFGVAFNGLGDFSRSEDVAQETFVTAWEKGFNLAEPARIAGWLCGIARNLVRNERRKHSRETASEVAQATAADGQTSVEDQTIAAEEADFLWTVLERIPENYREPLVLYYREEASIADVAKAMDVSEDVVRQRLSRGRKMLEERVTELVEGTLGKRRPSKEFAAGVFLAIQSSPGAKAAGGAITAAAAKTPAAGLPGFLLGPMIGIAGAIFGSKKSLDSATSEVERRFLWKMIVGITLLVGLLMAAEMTITAWAPTGGRTVARALLWITYSLVLTIAIVRGNARIQRIKQEHGTEAERQLMTETAKPVPNKAATWNLVGSIVGAALWTFIISIIRSDWLGLLFAVILVGGILAGFLPRFRSAKSAGEQRRTNFMALGVLVLGMIVLTANRWDIWRLWEWM